MAYKRQAFIKQPSHHCHFDPCNEGTSPKMFMCKTHWYEVPKSLRNLVWEYYQPGQEKRKDPTPEYLFITIVCRLYLAERYKLAELSTTLKTMLNTFYKDAVPFELWCMVYNLLQKELAA